MWVFGTSYLGINLDACALASSLRIECKGIEVFIRFTLKIYGFAFSWEGCDVNGLEKQRCATCGSTDGDNVGKSNVVINTGLHIDYTYFPISHIILNHHLVFVVLNALSSIISVT